MNRKLLISVVVIFVLSMAFGFLVHGTILRNEYLKLVPNLMRGEADGQAHFAWMLLATLSSAIGFSWIYIRGREAGKPWLGQGVRFGIAMVLVAVIPLFLINYAVSPFPSDLVAQQIVYESITVVIMGIVVAWLNR
jgi:hypothetical protein